MTETTHPSSGNSSGNSAEANLIAAFNRWTSPPEPADLSGPAMENAAVGRCCRAYMQAIETARKVGEDRYDGRRRAREAYRYAMPPLSGSENIRAMG